MTHVIIVHGPPGAGKTKLRKEKFGDLPFIDVDDLRKQLEKSGVTNSYDNYEARMNMLAGQLASTESEKVVVEGIFARGTHSYRWLLDIIETLDFTFEFQLPEYSLYSAVQHLCYDYRTDWDLERFRGRLRLLVDYEGKF
jgi:hypothetical protein